MDGFRRWLANMIAGRGPAWPDAHVTSDRIMSSAKEEGVVVLLHDMLVASRAQSLPAEFRAVIVETARGDVAGELARGAEAKQVLEALADSGIRALALKGTALAYWLYEHPAQRSRGDFDVLVASIKEAQRAIATLRDLGYKPEMLAPEEAAEFETALVRITPGGMVHRIDLHWRLLDNARLAKGFSFDELWAHSQWIPKLGASARGLGGMHALMHAALHRVTNIPSGDHNRLIWLYDIHLLTGRMTSEDWMELDDACATRGIAAIVLDGMQASIDAFGTHVPEGVMHRLDALAGVEGWDFLESMDAASFDRAHLAALPWDQKLGWLQRKLFPTAEFMRFRYGVTGGIGLMRAYMGRWWVGAKRALGGVIGPRRNRSIK